MFTSKRRCAAARVRYMSSKRLTRLMLYLALVPGLVSVALLSTAPPMVCSGASCSENDPSARFSNIVQGVDGAQGSAGSSYSCTGNCSGSAGASVNGADGVGRSGSSSHGSSGSSGGSSGQASAGTASADTASSGGESAQSSSSSSSSFGDGDDDDENASATSTDQGPDSNIPSTEAADNQQQQLSESNSSGQMTDVNGSQTGTVPGTPSPGNSNTPTDLLGGLLGGVLNLLGLGGLL